MPDPDKFFRFEDLEVWQRAAELAIKIGDVADLLEDRHRYRLAEQLRAASLSISNNIAEGSGSNSNKDFRHFLNMSRRSAFECASMLIIFERQQFVSADGVRPLIAELHRVCRMLTGLRRSLE
jgi:four helix bundle protein